MKMHLYHVFVKKHMKILWTYADDKAPTPYHPGLRLIRLAWNWLRCGIVSFPSCSIKIAGNRYISMKWLMIQGIFVIIDIYPDELLNGH